MQTIRVILGNATLLSFFTLLFLFSCSKKDEIDMSKMFFSQNEIQVIKDKIAGYSKGIDSGKNADDLWVGSARYRLLLQDFQGALANISQVQHDPERFFIRAFIYYELGNDENAFADLENYIKYRNSGSSEKNYVLAQSKVEMLRKILREKEQNAIPSRWNNVANHEHCEIYNPSPVDNEVITWTGNCMAGKAEGKGILHWGEVKHNDHGTMHAGYFEGPIEMFFENGTRFTGSLSRSELVGEGRWEYSSGVVFLARYDEGHNLKEGTYVYPDGRKYTGNFSNNRPSENGSAWCPDGKKTFFRIARDLSGKKKWDIHFDCGTSDLK